jgi:hypothetical protein|nr:MAG TPA: ASCH domain protein [Caudoviricetes sp.]
MSNALRRNKKPTFYTKQEMRIIGRNDFEKRNADKVIAKSYKDFVVIGYIILHDKFGFGQTRIIRLQEISAESALAEGADKYIHTNGGLDENMTITSFIGIWNSTIKKSDIDRYGWDANPWVWVIEFERCEKPEGV